MASSAVQSILFFFLVYISFSIAQTSSKPKALILPVRKDETTLQYVTYFNMGTPLSQQTFVVDLGGRHLWMDCSNESYISSSFKQSRCGTAPCSVAKATCGNGCLPGRQGCNNHTCWMSSENTIIHGGNEVSTVSIDRISLVTTDGVRWLGEPVEISNFIFGCAIDGRLSNLAAFTKGMLGLGREAIALPTQLSSAFGGSFPRKFAICLPSAPNSDGVIFFGDSPYAFYPSYNTSKTIDVSSSFQHTKLYVNTLLGSSVRAQRPQSPEYFIKVTSILVNQKPININSSLLEFQPIGTGGTKLSTVEPYTKLERTIYKALVKAFDKEIAVHNVSKVAPVAPFKDCYNASGFSMSPLGIGVPDIAFVFENNQNVKLELFGANSMVELSHNEACLAFLEEDVAPKVTTPIVIGTHQLQDHLLQFDLATNRLAFTSALELAAIQCSNFNF